MSRPTITRRSLVAVATVALAAAAVATVTLAATPSNAAANCSAGYVALTFDDGPNSGNTNNLLNTLKSAGVRATLFNIGQNAQNNQALVRAEVAAGMWIGNHSWSHQHMTSMSSAQMSSDLSQTQNAIQQAGAPAPKIFRPPYGETNATLRSAASALGLTQVTWDVDSQDWNGASTSAIVSAANNLQNGGLMLMHDQYQTTIAAIPQIVTNLNNRGLCAGMISPSTGRAVAPDGVTPTTPGGNPTITPPGGGGSCTAVYAETQRWGDRFNGQVTITGASTWTVVVAVTSPQKISTTWNGTASWDSSGSVMTMKSNGSGNTFGFTVMANGNWNTPTVRSCTAS